MPVNKPDRWAQYEATPAATVKPDKWVQYEAAPQGTASVTSPPELSTNFVTPETFSPEGFLKSLAAPLVGVAKGLKSAVYEGPQNPTEAAITNDPRQLPLMGRAVLAAKRMLVDPQIDQGKQALDEFKQAGADSPWYSFKPSPAAATHRELALGHGLASVIPMLGPWAAQVGQKEGEQVGTGNYSGAAGTAFGNALLALAPKAAGGVKDLVPGAVRRIAGSGPGVARDLVRKTVEDNRQIGLHNTDRMADAQQTWQEKQAKANTDHQAELLRLRQKYAQDTRAAAEKARIGTDADRAAYQAKQLASKQEYEQSVRNQTQKFQTEKAAAEKANAEAQSQYNQKIGETARQNREATAAERAKADQAAHLQVGGSQLIYGLRQLDKTLRDRAGVMFDAVREKVGAMSRPGTDLGTRARAALTKISGSSTVPKLFSDILGKYPESEPDFIEYQGAQIPKTNRLYDVLKQQGIGTGAPPVTFGDLQGYYTETGAELAKGTLPGDVYQATKELHNAVGDMMQEMANSAGAGKQLLDSRVFYRNYMDTFHEPAGPSSSGSPVAQALLAKDPLVAADKFAGDSGDRGIAVLRRYSDSLANLAQDIRQRAQAKVTVPARKFVAEISQPKTKPVPAGANLSLPPVQEPAPVPRAQNLPLPPIMPEVEQVPFKEPKLTPTRTISADDIQRANEAGVHRRGQGVVSRLIGLSVVWPAFRMLGELTRGRSISTGGLAAIPAAGATGMAIEEILSHPGVKEFLTGPTRSQLAQIPLELRGDMPNIVAAAKSHGVPVSPLLAAYASTIQRNRGQGQQPVLVPQGAPQ